MLGTMVCTGAAGIEGGEAEHPGCDCDSDCEREGWAADIGVVVGRAAAVVFKQ